MFFIKRLVRRRVKSLILSAALSALGFGGIRSDAAPLVAPSASPALSATIAAT